MSDATRPTGRAYAFSVPRSRMIESNVSKAFARQIVAARQLPAGCIWLPGSHADSPVFGDLYEPDPSWQPPRLIRTEAEERAAKRRAAKADDDGEAEPDRSGPDRDW